MTFIGPAVPVLEHLELAHQTEHRVPFIDVVLSQGTESLEAECFHVETGEYASIDHAFAEVVEGHRLAPPGGEIARQAARKGVPRPGRIVNILQWIRAAGE